MIAGGEGVAIIERDLTADSWQYLLGYKLTMELISEAHDNAKRFKQLLAEEAEETNKRRGKGGDIHLKIQENKNARKQLARGASAAT